MANSESDLEEAEMYAEGNFTMMADTATIDLDQVEFG